MEYDPLTDAELEIIAEQARDKRDLDRQRLVLELMHLRRRVTKNEQQLDLLLKTVTTMLTQPQVELEQQAAEQK